MKYSRLFLIRGLPGSGKSTFAKRYFWMMSRHLEADMYFIKPNGDYVFEPNKIKQAHEWCQQSARIFLTQGYDVIVSNTFTTVNEMKFYLDFAKENNIPVEIARMTKDYGSIHNVPQDVIDRMRSRFEDYEGEIYV